MYRAIINEEVMNIAGYNWQEPFGKLISWVCMPKVNALIARDVKILGSMF
jgi:hypothetical protein